MCQRDDWRDLALHCWICIVDEVCGTLVVLVVGRCHGRHDHRAAHSYLAASDIPLVSLHHARARNCRRSTTHGVTGILRSTISLLVHHFHWAFRCPSLTEVSCISCLHMVSGQAGTAHYVSGTLCLFRVHSINVDIESNGAA